MKFTEGRVLIKNINCWPIAITIQTQIMLYAKKFYKKIETSRQNFVHCKQEKANSIGGS